MNKTKFFSSLLVAALFASTSVFTSCKDYDDDIKSLQEQINARSLKTDLETLRSDLTSQLNSVQSSLDTKTAALNQAIAKLQTALDTKADASTVAALDNTVSQLSASVAQLLTSVDDLTAKAAALQSQIDEIDTALADYAKTSDLEALAAKVTELTGKFEDAIKALKDQLGEETNARQVAVKAVEDNLALQEKALNDYKDEMAKKMAALEEKLNGIIEAGDAASVADALKNLREAVATINSTITEKTAELEGKIAAVDAKLADYAKTEDVNALVSELRTEMQILAVAIIAVQDEVDVLNAFVNKRLTSLVLMPEFYWEGLEAVEVPSLSTPYFAESKKPYTFTYTVNGATLGNQKIEITVDKVMEFAYFDKDNKLAFANVETDDTWPTGRDQNHPSFGDETDYAWASYPEHHSLLESDLTALMPRDAKGIDYVTINNGGVAYYHINPATADLDGMNINFFENDAEVYTRSGFGWIEATPKESTLSNEMKEDGILTVPFDVDWDALYLMFYDWCESNPRYFEDPYNMRSDPLWGSQQNTKAGVLPFIAAQVSKGDTVVTSDYAVVVPALYKIVALADNNPNEAVSQGTFTKDHGDFYGVVRHNHLYESVGYDEADDEDSYGAIPMPATHAVMYNGIFKVDFVETHYDYVSYAKYGTSTKDQIMDEETMAQLGLHYEYKLINYKVNQNETGESVHMAQVDADGKDTDDKTSPYFAPRKVTAKGETIANTLPGEEAVDKEPLIRVDLVNADGKIVRYGYIKVRIVKDIESYNDLDVTITLDKDLYMNCGDETRVTWAQMENLILAELNNGNGMTKQDFEKNYYLEVVSGAEDMPTNENGALYQTAATNNRMATRYYYDDEAGKYKPVTADADGNMVTDDQMAYLDEYSADINWFGRVWYTPHDNSTTSHDWDEATNVLVWNLGTNVDSDVDADASNMTRPAFYKMMEVLEATYKNHGISQQALSTVVRFVNKTTGASIWVTLVIPVEKIHFAYADIDHRDLGHWYDFKNGYARETEDTIEVYANVPTPAAVAKAPLTTSSFEKNLNEYWLNNVDMYMIHDAAHFDKFTGDNIHTKFQFRLPQKGDKAVDGVNSIDEGSADASKLTWTVKGISGATYTLQLKKVQSDYYNQIVAIKRDGADLGEIICKLDPVTGVIHYNGRDEDAIETEADGAASNNAATDILNYIGRYKEFEGDKRGVDKTDDYLDGQDDKTFTAYVEILVESDACYDPLIDNNYFNVRFLRPINAWSSDYEIVDAPNATQFINIWELIYIRDWRKYAVVMDKQTQKFGAKNVDGTGEDGKTYKGIYADNVNGSIGSVPYTFYGIDTLWVERSEIRTDHYLTESVRKNILRDPAKIQALRSIDDVPSLTNGDTQYLKLITFDQANESYSVTGTTGNAYASKKTDVIAYTNNSGVVQEFHLYVPISIHYPWGAVTDWTQKVWAVITVKPTVGN